MRFLLQLWLCLQTAPDLRGGLIFSSHSVPGTGGPGKQGQLELMLEQAAEDKQVSG